jgi:hypothetical protein
MWESWRAESCRGDSWRGNSWRTDSWRTYISFALVGAIFILCQALSGGAASNKPGEAGAEAGDRSYRESSREETAGRGGVALPNVNWPPAAATARYTASREARLLTD